MLRRVVLIVFILLAILVAAVVGAALLIDPDDYREELAARASEQLGREVRLDGPIDLKYFPWIALEVSDVRVGNPPGFETAPMLAEVTRATAAVRLLPLIGGRVEVGAVTLGDAEVNLVTANDGGSNLDGLFAASEQVQTEPGEPPDLSRVSTGEIRIDNVVLNLIDRAADSRTSFVLESLRLDPFVAGESVGLALSGAVRDAAGDPSLIFDFAGALRVAPSLSEIDLSDWSLDFEMPGAGLDGTASGSLSARIGQDPVRVSLEQTRLTVNDQQLEIDGSASLGERIAGDLSVSGERFDLTRLGGAGARAPADDAPEAGQPDPAASGDYSGLSALDLAFALDLAELVLADGATLTEVSARSRISEGVLRLDPLSARLFGGRFEGSARVDFTQKPPRVEVRPELDGIEIGQLAALVTGEAPVAGQGNARLAVTFEGFSPREALGSLDGEGRFSLADGVLRGVDLRALIDDELSSSNLERISRAFGGQTRFETLDAVTRIDDGVVTLPDIDLSAAGYRATGSGRIDLGAGSVDYQLELDLGDELTARLPEALARATGGRIPLSLSGPLTRPNVTVDVASLAERAVREEIGRRLFEALRGDDEQAQEPEPEAGEPPP
jgi:AsmA protein